jgi:hypothetical protein
MIQDNNAKTVTVVLHCCTGLFKVYVKQSGLWATKPSTVWVVGYKAFNSLGCGLQCENSLDCGLHTNHEKPWVVKYKAWNSLYCWLQNIKNPGLWTTKRETVCIVGHKAWNSPGWWNTKRETVLVCELNSMEQSEVSLTAWNSLSCELNSMEQSELWANQRGTLWVVGYKSVKKSGLLAYNERKKIKVTFFLTW